MAAPYYLWVICCSKAAAEIIPTELLENGFALDKLGNTTLLQANPASFMLNSN